MNPSAVRSQRIASRALLGALCLAVLSFPTTGLAVSSPASELRLLKFRDYMQTSNAAPTTIQETGMFIAIITEDPGQFGFWDVTVNGSPPASGGFDSGYEGTTGQDLFLEYFDDYLGTQGATVDANYPNNATYCFNISGGTAGTLQQCESGLGTENWGNIPALTGNNFTELNTWDVTQEFTLTIPTPAASTSAVSVEINTDEEDEVTVWTQVDFGPQFETSIVVPADTLTKGVPYELLIEFANANAMASGSISPNGGSKGWNSGTSMLFTPTGPPATEYRLIKFRDYEQTSNAQPSALAEVGFFAYLELSDEDQLTAWNVTVDGDPPASGGTESGYDGEIGIDTELEYYDDYAGNDQATVDANYPSSGTEYCFNISGGDAGTLQQCETGLGAENYSVVPYLTGSQYDSLSDIDTSSIHTFTINEPSGSVTNVHFEIYLDNEDETTVFSLNQNVIDGPYELEIDVPADTLEEGVAYAGFIEFASAIAGGTGAISPNDTNSKAHNVATDFLFTVPEPTTAWCHGFALLTLGALRRRQRAGVVA